MGVRILVASDRFGALSSRRAGEVIASGWPQESTDVVPVGEAGHGFVEAFGEAYRGHLQTFVEPRGLATVVVAGAASALSWEPAEAPTDPIPYVATSLQWGQALRRVMEHRPQTVYVDLVGPRVHDAGAGALAALGARADVPLDQGVGPLSGLTRVDLSAARELTVGVDLVGVVPEHELPAMLLGLRGITSRSGREPGEDPARLLATDAALERLATLAASEAARLPGSGACGGLGFAVLALGGRLVTGPSVTLEPAARGPRPELVVTGCAVFDFARRGGGVVAEAARLATAALCPCVVLAGEVFVGAREMRAMGIEAAYPVWSGAAERSGTQWPVSEHELAELARRVARTWRW